MSVELISVLIAVLAIGATLGGLILTSNRGLRQGHGAAGIAAGWEDRRAGIAAARGHGEDGVTGCERTPVSCETTSSN